MAAKSKTGDKIQCSFCGRSPEEVQSIIAGPDVYICDICVSSSVDIIRNTLASFNTRKGHRSGLTPVQIKKALDDYVALAQGLGLAATSRMALGTEAVETATRLCRDVAQEFPRALFFAGKLVFEEERWYQRLLHNETAYQLQRRLQFAGLNAMVLPVRVLEPARAA